MSASPRLVINYGSVGTVAVLAWPDGQWSALLFDGQRVLPSAVYTDPAGRTVTGHQAWQRADDTAGTFTPSPSRTGTATDPAVRQAAQVLAAATLRRVTDEATRAAGEPVTDVRLVVPGGWGPRRRTWLREAAAHAGIRQPALLVAPVVVAGLLPILEVPVPGDAAVLVLDLGSGCEATVLRRTSSGFDVSCTMHDPDAGGDAVDEALLAHLNQRTASPAAAAPPPPADVTDPVVPDGRRWAALAGVRAGKEALTHRATAAVALPPPAPVAIITTDTVRHAAQPVLQRTAALAQQAIAAADIDADDVYGVYCIGAATATPGLADALAERLGIIPAVLPDPEIIAALGAAAVTTQGHTPAPPPLPIGGFAAITAVIVPAAASLTLFAQFLLTTTAADRDTGGGVVNWGELALAAVFAVLACFAGSRPLGTLLPQVLIAQTPPPPPPPAATPDSRLRYGAVLAATMGLAGSGVYAVLAALFARLPLDAALRWTVLPAVCIATAVVTVTLVTTHPRPRPGPSRTPTACAPTFPIGATLLTSAGMLLIQYILTAPRPTDLALYLDLGIRIGGLLVGIGVAVALVKALLLRLVLALPWSLLTAAIASADTTGILATVFTLAVLCWSGYPLLTLLAATPSRRPAPSESTHTR